MTVSPPTATGAVAAAGLSALAEINRLWALNIYDPAPSDATTRGLFCKHTIESLIAACGWTWALPYLGHDRSAGGVLKWCGLTAGACWIKAGLDPKIAKIWFGSTERLDAYGKYERFGEHENPKPTSGELRRIVTLNERSTELDLPFQPQAGDIVTMGPIPTEENKAPDAGEHVLVTERFDAASKTFHCVSGNGVGLGPDGKKMWGIVKSQVPLGGASWHARRLVRPAAGDLV